MALQKDMVFPTGVIATYHRIERALVIYNTENRVEVTVDSYLDKAARDAEKQPVLTDVYPLTHDGSTLDRAVLYTGLKGLELFTGASDV